MFKHFYQNFSYNIFALIFLLLLFFVPAVFLKTAASEITSQQSWKVWRESSLIRVSYRRFKSDGLIEVKAELEATSTLSGFLLFIQDTNNVSQWLDNATSMRIIDQQSPYDNVFVTHFKGFWPIKPRYMVVKSHFQQLDDLSIVINVEDAKEKVDATSKAVRLQLIAATWHIMPLPDNKVSIRYQVIVDPKGSIPLWIANKFSLRTMWTSLENLQQQLPHSPNQSNTLPHIKELNF